MNLLREKLLIKLKFAKHWSRGKDSFRLEDGEGDL